MWVTFFALATAVAVWFSAASLAVQLDKGRSEFNAALEGRGHPPAASRRLSSASDAKAASPAARLD
jgi:hypothetical protein